MGRLERFDARLATLARLTMKDVRKLCYTVALLCIIVFIASR